MNFNINAKILSSLLQQVSGFVGTTSVSLSIKKNRLVASAAKDGTSLSVVCKELVIADPEGQTTVDASIVNKVLSNRGDVVINLKESMLNIATSEGRKYSADIHCLPFEEITHISPKADGMKLNSDILYEIVRVMPMCRISSVYMREEMFVLISSGGGKFRMAVYDSFHVAYHEVVGTAFKEEVSFTLPMSALQNIISLADNKEFDLFVEDNRVYAKAPHFFVSVPKQACSIQQYSFDSIEALRDGCTVENVTSRATVLTQELREVVANSLAIADSGVPINFSVKKGKIVVNIGTTFGKVNAVLETERSDLEWGTEVHAIEPFLLNDLISVVNSKHISLCFIEHQICFIATSETNTTSFYGCNVV